MRVYGPKSLGNPALGHRLLPLMVSGPLGYYGPWLDTCNPCPWQ